MQREKVARAYAQHHDVEYPEVIPQMNKDQMKLLQQRQQLYRVLLAVSSVGQNLTETLAIPVWIPGVRVPSEDFKPKFPYSLRELVWDHRGPFEDRCPVYMGDMYNPAHVRGS